ncbi:hypothetical protein [Vogesella indigofera]|uniref:hypothetical protein n=1 Tax=Vogesella indigofera TaxID=45465 RepID=UPI00234E8C4F|nr:hypothetical protein [Vogesella indigofera]MDC7706148.1 hypothetical protein [Vogesella indigofera]
MAEAIRAVGAVGMLQPAATATSQQRLQPGDILNLRVAALLADGSVQLEGDALSWLLRQWPASLPPPVPGSVLPFRVLAAGPPPQLTPLLPSVAPPEMSPVDDGPPLAATLPAPAFRQAALPPAQLASAWREALVGTLAAAAAQFHREAGSHLPGALLGALPDLALASLRGQSALPLPLWLPMWLWGGPLLGWQVEDQPEAEDAAAPPAALDLLLECELPQGRLRLRLRLDGAGLLLCFHGEDALCHWLQTQRGSLLAALHGAGFEINACHIATRPALSGLALGRHGVSLFEASRLPASLFAAAALILEILLPASPASPPG